MKINDYTEKLDAIRRYRAAKDKQCERQRGVNAPDQIQLWFDGEHCEFTLSGNEMARLLSDFPDIGSIEDLFLDR